MMTVLATICFVSINGWCLIKQRIELENETVSLFAFIQRMRFVAIFENKIIVFRVYQLDRGRGVLFVVSERDERTESKEMEMAQYSALSSISISSKFVRTGGFSFHGPHNTAEPGSLTLQNNGGATKIVVSSKGRLRYCSLGKVLSRIPAC